MSAPVKSSASSGTSASIANQFVLVQAIDSDNNVAHVLTQSRAPMTLSSTFVAGKGVGFPAEGETWLISSLFGGWMFITPVVSQPSATAVISDGDSRLSDARTPTGTAGGALSGTYPNPTLQKPTLSYLGTAGNPAFQNSWAAGPAPFQAPCFYLSPTGEVHLQGQIRSGTSNSVAFTLPAGYRPSGSQAFIQGTVTVTVANTGTVTIGSSSTVNLGGICFLAEV